MGVIKRKTKEILEKKFNRRVNIIHVTPELLELEEQMRTEAAKVYHPMVDVLFIDGCGDVLPHPSRYRVTHQRMQLEQRGISTNQIYVNDLTPDCARFAKCFVFFRCAYNEVIEEFIDNARILGRKILYDVDDLVIDTRYTNENPYVSAMAPEDKEPYDANVRAMGQLLSMCDGAVTTTEALCKELKIYTPNVIINRNTASPLMLRLSEEAYQKSNKTGNLEKVTLGYFSGSITHNQDFELIEKDLVSLMDMYPFLHLKIVGILSVPESLKDYSDRIETIEFCDYKLLPQLIADCDINLAPLTNNIFSAAKSENKWVEAALVRVPTVASNVGAMRDMIRHQENGFLCSDGQWYQTLSRLIMDGNLRKSIGEAAYDYAVKYCITSSNTKPYADFVKSYISKSAVFVLPSTELSGGMMVALKHATYLRCAGYDISLLCHDPNQQFIIYENQVFPVLHYLKTEIKCYYDKAIASMWSTADFFERVGTVGDKYYLVQNFEPDFYDASSDYKAMAEKTYCMQGVKYITISKWITRWLNEGYNQQGAYAPNGIELSRYRYHKRTFGDDKKIRVLIEGDSGAPHKRVDESFEIVNQLDRDKFEIVYLSYSGKPKDWYICDEFHHRVPYEQVHEIYESCDIILKSSILESFSYPPLEMLATGGYVVAVINDGNSEYLKDGYNCLGYASGNIDEAARKINLIVEDVGIRATLNVGAHETADKYDWQALEKEILALYDL